MSVCGECSFFIDINDFPELLKLPMSDRIVKCYKERWMDSLQYSCKLFEDSRGNCSDCKKAQPQYEPMCQGYPNEEPPCPGHTKLNLRGGHEGSQGRSAPELKPVAGGSSENEGSIPSPPNKPKLNLRKTEQPTLGDF